MNIGQGSRLWRRGGIFLLFLLLVQLSCTAQLSDEQKFERFFHKKSPTILVTDSGLGGVSIAADVVERLKPSGLFQSARVVFFNAQPHLKSGYNRMKTTEQKVHVFENALQAMEKTFHPDMILIGCNTLSVLYPYTRFASQTQIPVVGIVRTGVKVIEQAYRKYPDAQIFIFATKTTVKQGKHKQLLVQDGIPTDHIIAQACPGLAGRIERGPDSPETRARVQKYVDRALESFADTTRPILVSLNCTHYGYVRHLFEEAFQKRGYQVADVLDPNPYLGDFLFRTDYLHRYPETDVSVEVYSQPVLPRQRLENIARLIEKRSPQTAEALRQCQFTPDLFEWKSIAGDTQ